MVSVDVSGRIGGTEITGTVVGGGTVGTELVTFSAVEGLSVQTYIAVPPGAVLGGGAAVVLVGGGGVVAPGVGGGHATAL